MALLPKGLFILCCQLLLLLHAATCRQVRLDYIGCYVDFANSIRDLNGLTGIQQLGIYTKIVTDASVYNSAMTYEYCSRVCSLGGFAYMGLQHGVGCYCGNSYGSQGVGTGCTSACGGDSSRICGGSSRNSVFALTYLDKMHFVLSERLYITMGSSYLSQPTYSTVMAADVLSCATLCKINCQAVLFSLKQRLCYLMKFRLIPSSLSGISGDFYVRN